MKLGWWVTKATAPFEIAVWFVWKELNGRAHVCNRVILCKKSQMTPISTVRDAFPCEFNMEFLMGQRAFGRKIANLPKRAIIFAHTFAFRTILCILEPTHEKFGDTDGAFAPPNQHN